MITEAINSRDVDIYRTSPDNNAISHEINKRSYQSIYVYYASDQLIKNLEHQFGDNLIQIEDPELYNQFWQIKKSSDWK